MGYELHITRRKRWSERGPDIAADEWLAYVSADPELSLQPTHSRYFTVWSGESQLDQPWLDWADGQIYTKYPDPALVTKMAEIARAFGGTVQGDDGEIYKTGAGAPQQPQPSIRERIAAWLRRRQGQLQAIPPQESEFRVGDRVRDVWGNVHTVIEVDPTSMHGMGIIRTRSDTGTEHGFSMCAHGLTLAQETRNDAV